MAQFTTKFIKDNAVTGPKVRLDNNQGLRARNAGDSADVELMKLDTSDILQFLSHPQISTSAAGNDDVLTRKDLNAELEGLKPKEACRVATTADITLATAPASIDGITLASGDRVLVKDQTLPAQNGIYDFNGAGSAMTRSSDMDSTSPINEVNGAYTAVQEGTENEGKFFAQSGTVTTLDTDAINFVFFNSSAGLSGGDGIDISSDIISVDLSAAPYLEISGGKLQAKTSADFASAAAGDLMDAADIKTAVDGKEPTISAGTTAQYWRGDKTFQTLDKAAVGLANVDNTSDADKPVSTATQTALDGKEPTITAGTTAQYWRGDKTFQTLDKAAVGLSDVDNTSDADKPISTATQSALDLKADASSLTTPNREIFTLDGTDISNGYVDLAQTPVSASVEVTPVGGPLQEFGVDYTLSTNRVTFAGDLSTLLASGDKLIISYVY